MRPALCMRVGCTRGGLLASEGAVRLRPRRRPWPTPRPWPIASPPDLSGLAAGPVARLPACPPASLQTYVEIEADEYSCGEDYEFTVRPGCWMGSCREAEQPMPRLPASPIGGARQQLRQQWVAEPGVLCVPVCSVCLPLCRCGPQTRWASLRSLTARASRTACPAASGAPCCRPAAAALLPQVPGDSQGRRPPAAVGIGRAGHGLWGSAVGVAGRGWED